MLNFNTVVQLVTMYEDDFFSLLNTNRIGCSASAVCITMYPIHVISKEQIKTHYTSMLTF